MSNNPARIFDRKALYSDTKRIINTHICHLLPLSIFFLPLSFSLLTFTGTLLESHFITNQSIPSCLSLLLLILYTLFVLVLALCGVATITYTTYHAYCSGPVNVFTSIKSLSRSFVRLASMLLAGQLSIIVMCLLVAVCVQAAFKVVQICGIRVDTTSYYIILYSVSIVIAIQLFLTNWGLASAIVVTESKWGFEPLWRSAYLLQGVSSESFFILLLSVTSIGIMIWSNSIIALSFGISWWTNWALVFQAGAASCYIVLIMLQHVASNTVLYMHCKALQGELAVAKAAQELPGGYVSLRVDRVDDETEKQQSPLTPQVPCDEPNGVFEYLFFFLTAYWFLLGLCIYFF